jgi:hypothetical protein
MPNDNDDDSGGGGGGGAIQGAEQKYFTSFTWISC